MKVTGKFVHARRVAEHFAALIEANKDNPEVPSLVDLVENGFRKIVNDSGTNNNCFIVLAEKEFDERITYPYFSFLPDDKRLT